MNNGKLILIVQMLLLADGIDATKRNKAGIQTSCTPDGWPYSSAKPFKLLERGQVQVFPNPFGPNNEASRSGFGISVTTLIGIYIYFIILH